VCGTAARCPASCGLRAHPCARRFGQPSHCAWVPIFASSRSSPRAGLQDGNQTLHPTPQSKAGHPWPRHRRGAAPTPRPASTFLPGDQIVTGAGERSRLKPNRVIGMLQPACRSEAKSLDPRAHVGEKVLQGILSIEGGASRAVGGEAPHGVWAAGIGAGSSRRLTTNTPITIPTSSRTPMGALPTTMGLVVSGRWPRMCWHIQKWQMD
jgi:hypothetical protein